MARKTGGKGPGNCRGKEECEAYCEDPTHAEECINFALEYGFISPEEAENAKKMLAAGLTGGPGGCRGKEECEAYCDDPAHFVECIDFAEKAGFISPEEAQKMKEMMQQAPPDMPPEGIPPGEIPPEMMPPSEIPVGPGGCRSETECIQYCSQPEHFKECQKFAPVPKR